MVFGLEARVGVPPPEGRVQEGDAKLVRLSFVKG